ncbi:DUF6528 family protein [Paenibacillus lautus]|uniref:DUF6528 family protein n=1 Tax=Paenibacillus lautus TaxID=1401 RepID=UPI002DB8B3E2|nr:DUF6528 family protein [Paenibacillus lautus]MEC0311191.1 DUF6528 family protein [Paenibacillus lautus]
MSGNMTKDYPIACTDQKSHRILVFSPSTLDWSADESEIWSWSLLDVDGCNELLQAWGLPTEAKLRHDPIRGGQCMIVTDSRGLAAIVPYPGGESLIWGAHVGGNPHSAELLPNGNLAVVASTAGWVRVYASSQGPTCEDYAEFPFLGAHGVHWDSRRSVLWALGDNELVALRLEGTDDQPKIVVDDRVPLPTKYGHDLHPVWGNDDRLWITTVSHVYQYVISSGQFDRENADCSFMNRHDVKSIGNQPSGLIVSTSPKAGGLYEWTTDEIRFHGAPNRMRQGAAIYKARIWTPEYSSNK